ncbi:cytosine permease [Tissierella creatinophila]|uniref:Cytosine permease n=1 Tax=Tissierella creatinophila DSM 6911 TaxID=1123403 RepID=A0A1U7M4I2_TISCR|nr:cytosine permease [Tissierella creatinophila]OLS02223.1 cytosine permease [Tissierella creatinophila DSM 6911]
MSENKTKKIASDDNPLGELPDQDRQGMFSMMVVLLGFTFFTSTMFAGGQIGPNYKFFPDLMYVIILGNLLLGIYVAALGYIAQKTGYNSVVLSRYSFGDKGSKLVDLLFAFTQIGWYAWGTATIAIVFVKMLGLNPGWTIPLMVVFGYGFSLTSYIGYKGIAMLSNIAVPAMAVLIFWSFSIGFKDVGGFPGLNKTPEVAMPFATALTLVFGTFVSGGTQSTNWTRFAKTPKVAIVASIVAFFLGNGLMVVAGAFGGYVYNQPDIVEVLVLQGLQVPAIIMLFFNVWTTQDNAIYSVSVAGCNFFRTEKRTLMNFAGATIATILAIAGMYNWLVPFLVLMGTVIPPIGGVIMADYYVKHKRKYNKLAEVKMKEFNYSGLIAYVIGAFMAYASPGVAPINGIIAAFIAFPIVDKILVSMDKPQENVPLIGVNVSEGK